MSRRFVYKWAERFLANRLDRLVDKTGCVNLPLSSGKVQGVRFNA